MSLSENLSIIRKGLGRLHLSRWQLAKLIVAQVWRETPIAQTFGLIAIIASLYIVARSIRLLYFHPLSKYPGPKLAAISKFWFAWAWGVGRYHRYVDDLHSKYGDIVRIGPNELSFATARSFQDIYGYSNKRDKVFIKSEIYDVQAEAPSVTSERNPDKHRELRRLLGPGFSSKTLSGQEYKVHEYVDLFIAQLKNFGTEKGVCMTEWFQWLTFDVTGELTFGEPFGALREAKTHFWIQTINDTSRLWGLAVICRLYPILWPLLMLIAPANMKSAFKRHESWTKEKVRSRIARRDEIKHIDFFSFLLSEKSRNVSEKFMLGQASLLIIAGSHTTSILLTAVLYHLLTNPGKLRKLQKEVRGAFKDVKEMDNNSLTQLSYLSGVVEEGLRLLPPIPLGLTRVSPGAEVDGHYIPEGIVVSTSQWTTSHSERYFNDSLSFHPERWLATSHPEHNPRFDNDNRNAARPFSLGTRSCLGMNLAYMEARITLAKMVWAFEWAFVNEQEVDWERGVKLELLLRLPDVKVRFTPREDSGETR